ncbi:hypothetical protein CHRYSEO8AT_180020 [Chryseobacterium sp. 8AT]|nr:hypothetical protein CHRYSEO8AT_180020 [Chryseobacterium sp. 8AT]
MEFSSHVSQGLRVEHRNVLCIKRINQSCPNSNHLNYLTNYSNVKEMAKSHFTQKKNDILTVVYLNYA